MRSAVIRRRCHLGDMACVSNFAHATARRRQHGRGRRRWASEAAASGGPGRRAAGSTTRKKRTEKSTPWREKPKSRNADLSYIRISYLYVYICIQGSPSGCVRREIPGVTQVDEKRHEGNTAVVTAYICWRKHGIYLSRGIHSD